MPRSKQRRKLGAPRRRDKAREARSRETQAAQQRAEAKKLTPAAYARRRALGWGLIGLAVVVFVQHLIPHMGFFTLISSEWDDLVAGYPFAALLAIGGAIVLSKT